METDHYCLAAQEPWIIGVLATHCLLLVLVLVFRKNWNLNMIIMVAAGMLLKIMSLPFTQIMLQMLLLSICQLVYLTQAGEQYCTMQHLYVPSTTAL